MKVRRTRFTSIAVVLTIGAAAMLLIAVASAPAGNRTPSPTLTAYPGPGEINYGENVGYTAAILNNQSSTFTHLVYHHLVPTTLIAGVPTPAKLVYASCEPGRTSWPDFAAGAYYTCPERSLNAGDTAKVLLVWQAPGKPTEGDGVTCGGTTDCVLKSSGYWTIKEGTGNTGSAGPDTFPSVIDSLKVSTSLLGADPDLSKARGYVLKTCTAGASLETSLVTPVGPSNRLFTSVCATSTPDDATNPLSPGLIVQIDETSPPGNQKGFPSAVICIPAPPTGTSLNTCDLTNYTAWSFDDPSTPDVIETAGFSFTIDNTTLPNGDKVDKVFHNGVDITSDCTIDIVNSLKITNVSCVASTNGSWKFT